MKPRWAVSCRSCRLITHFGSADVFICSDNGVSATLVVRLDATTGVIVHENRYVPDRSRRYYMTGDARDKIRQHGHDLDALTMALELLR